MKYLFFRGIIDFISFSHESLGGMNVLQKNKVIGVFSHVDGGKTTLMEAILYKKDVIKEIGNVNKGTTFLDNEPIERRRGITFSSKPVRFNVNQQPYTFIDTPGHMDLTFEMERILQVVDVAIVIVSAMDGVTGYTETIVDLCQEYGIPILMFVNKLDVDTVDLVSLKEELSCFSEKIIPFDTHSLEDNSEFLEEWALLDDDWLSIMVDNREIVMEDKLHFLSTAIMSQTIIPCVFGSALTLIGVNELLELLDMLELPRNENKTPVAQVYKITHDSKGIRHAHAKIISGTFHSKDTIKIRKSEDTLKINELFFPQGNHFIKVDDAKEGDIVTMTGLTSVSPGEFLTSSLVESKDIPLDISFKRDPIFEVQVVPSDVVRFDDMVTSFHLLANEDPMLKLRYKKEVNELYISIVGVIQMEYLKEIFLERFSFSIDFLPPSVLYKETITQSVIGVGHYEPLRHYAEVALLLEPGESGQGIVIKNKCLRENLEINFQQRVLQHIKEKTHLSVLTGSPLTDVTITLLDGLAHYPETKGGDFREATYRAIRHGLMKIKETSQLLEPWYSLKISVPSELVGKVSADVVKMGGTVYPTMTATKEMTTIEASVPVASFIDYPLSFASFTKNKGRLKMTLKGYYPCQNQEELIETLSYHPESDRENTANSIFFKKGKGYDVHWSEVDELKHLSI